MKPSWADIVEYGFEDPEDFQLPWSDEQDGDSSGSAEPYGERSWAQVVSGLQEQSSGYQNEVLVPLGSQPVAQQPALAPAYDIALEESQDLGQPGPLPEPGEPIGIRAVQSILMSATQSNLSHFHTAGMNAAGAAVGVKPSAAEAMDSLYAKHNTGMRFKTSASVRDLRRHMVGASLGSFVTTVGSSFTLLPDRENVWYEALGAPVHDNILRLYIDYRKMRDHGLTLGMLAQEAFGDDCRWRVSPDFMGMIDVEVNGLHMSTWLSRMGSRVCGTPDVVSCNVDARDPSTAVTRGTSVLVASRTPGVDKRTIFSNNVTEVEKMFGVEAAAGVLTGLLGSRIVSDFMARTGTVLPFSKRSEEVQAKGLLTSMGFERPKEDIKDAIVSPREDREAQVNECIMTGLCPPTGFSVITR